MNMNSPSGSKDSVADSTPAMAADIRHLSAQQLQALGVAQLAYVKPVVINGTAAFAIHAADGTPMAVAPGRDLAIAAILQHEMVPALVH